MWWFLLFVASLNIAAGFSLAVILAGHYGSRQEVADQHDPADELGSDGCESLLWTQSETPETPGPTAPAELEESVPDDRTEEPDRPERQQADELAGGGALSELDSALLAALDNGSLLEGASESPSEAAAEPSVGHEDEVLRAFQSGLGSFCDELVALDERLRSQPTAESAEVKLQLDAVALSNGEQDKACQAAEESLQGMIVAETIDAREGEAIIAAIQEERREAAETFRAFAELDGQADAARQCEMVLDKTAALLDANFVLRDSMSAIVAAVHSDDGQERTESGVDPLTELLSRAGLEGMLAAHWEKDPQRYRPVSLVMIDLDHFAKLNRKYGPAVGDRALRALAQLLKAESPPDCQLARFAGQRFVLLGIDRELKQAVRDAEHMRQTIETARFDLGTSELKITVSCGVVAVGSDDTQASLYARAGESVLEAKRYGRNRSFVHEGEFPTPVVPPNLAMNERHVTL
ncbi:MAG: sensor domain-containing diguanylate cyclase [Thermoguttaceae bacterium]